MWISKRKFQELEKRIADLEMAVRSQQKEITSLRDIHESVKQVFTPHWDWDSYPEGPPGASGYVPCVDEILPSMARLSLCGMLDHALKDKLCSVYAFLIPHYKSNLFSTQEELLRRIQVPALADRYVTPWERVLSILLKNQETKAEQELLISMELRAKFWESAQK